MPFFQFIKQNAPWLGSGMLMKFLSCFGQTFFISIFAGEIRESFDLTHGMWGGIYSLGTFASAVVMIWAGGLSDLFRVRVLGSACLVLLGCACLFMATNSSVALLPFAIFALRLMGQGMASHIAVVSMARWFVGTRGKALSISSLGFSAGEALLPILFVWLMIYYDWQFLWLFCAIVCCAGVPLLLVLLRQERTPQSLAKTNQSEGMLGKHWTRGQVLRHPLFWLMIPMLIGPSAFNTAFFFQQVHFAEIKGWDHIELVALFPVYTTVSILTMIVYGWALDKLGTAKLIPLFLIPMVGAFLAFAVSESISVAILGMVFLGLTSGGNAVLPAAFWAEFFGTRYIGSIKAMAAAVMVFGSAIGPGITGVLIDVGVGIETQYVAIAVFFAFACVTTLIGARRYGPVITTG